MKEERGSGEKKWKEEKKAFTNFRKFGFRICDYVKEFFKLSTLSTSLEINDFFKGVFVGMKFKRWDVCITWPRPIYGFFLFELDLDLRLLESTIRASSCNS